MMNLDVPIERQLLAFLEFVIACERPDLIVCGERKATAIMRALMQEMPEPRLQWEWPKVLSSTAMKAFDWAKFVGKRIVVFEELVHHGRSLRTKVDELRGLASPCVVIKTAGFAVWNRCQDRPDHSYYASVDAEQYREIRDKIISVLQVYGSLLLDTEHLELPVRVNCSVREFYEELAKSCPAGNAFSFLSSSKRLNLTLLEPDIQEPEQLALRLTPGSSVDCVVRKCRVIEKSQGHFSIMPIFYPNVKCSTEAGWLSALPDFISRERLTRERPKELFYVVGLLASIELLKGVVSAMTDLLKSGKVTLETPQDSLMHLSTIFPSIKIDRLWEYVEDVVASARQRKAPRSASFATVQHVELKDLVNMSYFVIENLRKEIEESSALEGAPKGRSWRHLLKIAERGYGAIPMPPMGWTTVPDRLIDSGLLVTSVEQVNRSNGEAWAIRTFLPDSEMVSDRLRRHAAVKGERWLPRT